jgi:WD40 repeat protein
MAALYGPTPQDLSLSWSPDGQRLAAWNGGDGRQVIVYGARSGRVVTTLPIPTSSYGSAQLNYSPSLLGEEMRWSSDGKHLALMSLELNSLIVWTLG